MRVGDVGGHDAGLAAVLLAERVDALLRGIAGRAPASQDQLPGAVGGQISGDLKADRSQRSGHQIRCVAA